MSYRVICLVAKHCSNREKVSCEHLNMLAADRQHVGSNIGKNRGIGGCLMEKSGKPRVCSTTASLGPTLEFSFILRSSISEITVFSL